MRNKCNFSENQDALYKKKILFISPVFFGYENDIKNKMEELGARVDFFDERPSNSAFQKGIIRLNKRLLSRSITRYYNKIYNQISDDLYDYFLLIKGECIPRFFLDKLKSQQKNAKFIYYSFDSIKNASNISCLLEFFDFKFSFDYDDCIRSNDFKFKPLFYGDIFLKCVNSAAKYDLSFIGTVHSDRYTIVQKIINQHEKFANGRENFLFFYCQSIFYYLFRKICDRDFRSVKRRDLKFYSLNRFKVCEIFKESKCIIDIQHPNQSGLTMRTIEAIGSRRKIITTNENVRTYDFYCPDNVLIVDRHNPKLDLSFIEKPYKDIDQVIFQKYSLASWIKDILGIV